MARLVVLPRLPSCSTSTTLGRIARHAGTSPKSTPDTIVAVTVNSSTAPSRPMLSARGTFGGMSGRSARMPHHATRSPTRPPVAVSIALSTIDRRTRIHRPAPKAARTAKSRDARAERTSSRLAMLPHAITRTSTTAANSTHNVWPMSPTTC